ncbi:unnamed protein product, partial [Adineta steineri]
LIALINLLIMNNTPITLNINSSVLSTKNDLSQVELNKLHDLANQTEQELQTAINSNIERNEQLNILLERSNLLLQKNQVFGINFMI